MKPAVGGKAKNRHWDKRDVGGRGGIGSGKVPVVGAVEREGKVVTRVIETVSGDILKSFVRGAVSEKVSLLVTDEWVGVIIAILCSSVSDRLIKERWAAAPDVQEPLVASGAAFDLLVEGVSQYVAADRAHAAAI